MCKFICSLNIIGTTLIKKKRKFSSYKRNSEGAVAKSYTRKGFLIYEEMRKYLVMYEDAVSHISEFPYI
jgi:hypothetical protein